MKKTLLGFTIVLLLMISEILILNNDISSLKASNKILQEDLKDKKNISTLKEEKEDFEEVVRLDLEYIDNWSIGLDIKIILKTIAVIFKHKGAR